MDKLKEAQELLQRLRDQHPKDTEEELSRRFAAAVRGELDDVPRRRQGYSRRFVAGAPTQKEGQLSLIKALLHVAAGPDGHLSASASKQVTTSAKEAQYASVNW